MMPRALGLHGLIRGVSIPGSSTPESGIPVGHRSQGDTKDVTEMMQIFGDSEESGAALNRCGKAEGEPPFIGDIVRAEGIQQGSQVTSMLQCDAREILKELDRGSFMHYLSLAPRLFEDLLFDFVIHKAAYDVPRGITIPAFWSERAVDPIYGNRCVGRVVEEVIEESRHCLWDLVTFDGFWHATDPKVVAAAPVIQIF